MCKFLELIKKFRGGNRILVQSDCNRTILLRRREEAEPLCRVEIKDKTEHLLSDIVAVLGALWLLDRAVRAIGRLFR